MGQKNIEFWEKIAGYENFYEVSTLARVRSKDRTLMAHDFKIRFYRGQIIKSRVNREYVIVDLWQCGHRKTVRLNRIVAQTFIPNPENLTDVSHIDDNKLNNNLTNLQWLSHQDNCNHGDRNKKISFASKGK